MPVGYPNGSVVAARRKLNGLIWSGQGWLSLRRANGRHKSGELTVTRLSVG